MAQVCKYGDSCYRKNEEHIRQYHSPSPKATIEREKDEASPPSKKIKLKDFDDIRDKIERLFLLKMPEDFYQLWQFCLRTDKAKPQNVFSKVGLELAGPYGLLDGSLPETVQAEDCILHHRFYYDPPEFQTVIVSNEKDSEFHFGYYRDSPEEMPSFVASNDSKKNCTLTPMAETIFGAIALHLENGKKKSPFQAMVYLQMIGKLKSYAKENGISLEINSTSMKKRQRDVVSKTFHGAGIVVPVDKKTEVGYRPLIEKDALLKKILVRLVEADDEDEKNAALAKLQPVITMASIATDESDFGTGLEIGIDFFCMGSEKLDTLTTRFLSIAYSMLNRDVYNKISTAHLKNRVKGNKTGILERKDKR